MKIITRFVLENNGRIVPIKRVRTLRELALYLYNDFIKKEGIKSTAEWIMEIVDADDSQISYYEATPLLGYLIWGKYNVLKFEGTSPLNSAERKHTIFTLGKLLQQTLTDYATKG